MKEKNSIETRISLDGPDAPRSESRGGSRKRAESWPCGCNSGRSDGNSPGIEAFGRRQPMLLAEGGIRMARSGFTNLDGTTATISTNSACKQADPSNGALQAANAWITSRYALQEIASRPCPLICVRIGFSW